MKMRSVARRLMAGTDDDDYGLLTLLVQLDYEPRGWFKIPASCFFPEPDVASACVVLVRRATPLLPEEHRATVVDLDQQSDQGQQTGQLVAHPSGIAGVGHERRRVPRP